MNIYFIDPTYIVEEGWESLLSTLKVKAVYSFINKNELSAKLVSLIKPYLKSAYSGQDIKKFSDSCAFWVSGHLEKHVKLIIPEYNSLSQVPKNEHKNYSTTSALSNLLYHDDENCLILLELFPEFDNYGYTIAPHYFVNELQDKDLPTHIAKYSLNILHKKCGHRLYEEQCSFILFDPYMSSAFRYNPYRIKWNKYMNMLKSGRSVSFVNYVLKKIKEKDPIHFPGYEIDGKRILSSLRNNDGEKKYLEFLDEARMTKERTEEYENAINSGDNWQDEVDEMNRQFWNECGEGGSNCESWPGWD